jgi:hypothetical protein
LEFFGGNDSEFAGKRQTYSPPVHQHLSFTSSVGFEIMPSRDRIRMLLKFGRLHTKNYLNKNRTIRVKSSSKSSRTMQND